MIVVDIIKEHVHTQPIASIIGTLMNTHACYIHVLNLYSVSLCTVGLIPKYCDKNSSKLDSTIPLRKAPPLV